MTRGYRPVMRAALVVLLAALALAAAGAAAARDPRAPQQRHTAADTRLARSVGLRRADLAAGWKAAPATKDPPPCSTEPDESKLVQTARVDPTFVWSDGVTTVGSEVDVFRSAGEARRDWRLSTLALMRRCLLETVQKAIGKGGKVRVTQAKALAKPGLGARSLHYRLVFALGGNAAHALVTDLIAFNRGRTSIVLHTLSVGAALPASALGTLGRVLSRRLSDASGGI